MRNRIIRRVTISIKNKLMTLGKSESVLLNLLNRVKKKGIIIICILLLGVLSSCKSNSHKFDRKQPLDELWQKTVSQTMNREIDLYNDAELLIVPLYASFCMKEDSKYLDQFNAYFNNAEDDIADLLEDKNIAVLNKLNYVYFISNYILLSNKRENKVSHTLVDKCYDFIMNTVELPAWNWNMDDFDNMRDRITYKISEAKPQYSYQKAITDEDLFVLVTANNLLPYYKNAGDTNKTKKLKELGDLTKQVIYKRFEYNGNHYAFQKGAWSDHRDYLYANYTDIEENMKPFSNKEIEEDTSHYSRMPLMLQNIACVTEDKNYKAKLETILNVNSIYFQKEILVNPSNESRIYRLMNYMNGSNGLYRWNYNGRGKDYAHKPYSLSKQLYTGKYVFFSSEMQDIYKKIAGTFPLTLNEVSEMTTLREVNDKLIWNESYSNAFPGILMNGYAELTCLLAGEYNLLNPLIKP